MLEFLLGFTSCWLPSSRCTVNWNAWAAIGTTAGVIAAIVGPWVLARHRKKKRTAVFGMIWIQRLSQLQVSIEALGRDFPIRRTANSWLTVEAFLVSHQDKRNELKAFKARLLTTPEELHVLAGWQDIDDGVLREVVLAFSAANVLALACGAVDSVIRSDESSRSYFTSFVNTYNNAAHACQRARDACHRFP